MTRPRRPDPPPMQTDDVRAALIGTAGWTAALIVLLIAGLPQDDRWWLWVCVAGIVIGLFGAWYVPRLQAGRARQATRRSAARAARTEPAAPTEQAEQAGSARPAARAEETEDAEEARRTGPAEPTP